MNIKQSPELTLPEMEKRALFCSVLEELFERYPLPGNSDNPKKAAGILKAMKARKFYLGEVWSYGYMCSSTVRDARNSALLRLATRTKIPINQLLALHAMMFP